MTRSDYGGRYRRLRVLRTADADPRPVLMGRRCIVRVAALWRYPVKSLGGERVDATLVGPYGLVGDRAYGIVDEASGHVLTARREPRLLFATARWRGGEAELADPDGHPLATDEDLSRWLGRPVHLARAGVQGGVYDNPRDTEHETDWVSWEGPGHAWHDSGSIRVSMVSTATVGDWAPERFRANVLLDGAGEDALVGHQVRLGTSTLDVRQPVSRCVMVTRAQPGIEVDREVLRSIHRDRGGDLAVGAVVVEFGRVEVGDEVVRSG